MPQYQGVWTLEQQAQAQSNQQWVTDPNFKNTTLLLQADGTGSGSQNQTFLDGSTNNFFITRNGNTTQGSFSPFSQTQGSWSNYLASSSALGVTLPSGGLGSGDFTIECWVYLNSLYDYINFFSTTRGSNGFNMGTDAAGLLVWYSGGARQIALGKVTANQWQHVAFVRSGSTLTGYLNGVSVGTATVTNNFSTTSGSIGSLDGGSEFMSGYISNLRIVTGTAVYTSNFTPSTTSLTAITNTRLLTCQSNRFVDNSGNNVTVSSTNGSPSVQAFSPFVRPLQWTPDVVGGSGYFDGTGDYLSCSVSASPTGTQNFTVEGWAYVPSAATDYAILINNNSSGGFYLRINSSGQINLVQTNIASIIASSSSVKANSWNYFSITRSGNTFNIYLNSTAVDATTSNSVSFSTGTATFVGADYNGGVSFVGYMSSLRVVIGTATAPSSVPTAPFTTVTNTQLLLNYTNAGIYDGTMNTSWETVNSAQVSTNPVKYGSGSIYFNGVASQRLLPSQNYPQLIFGTGDFTLECWLYIIGKNATTIAGIWDQRPGVNGTYINWVVDFGGYSAGSATAPRLVLYADSATFISSNVININMWNHVALCRANGITRMFINGVLASTPTADTKNYLGGGSAGNYRPSIGCTDGGDSLFGYIDDFRASRFARYIANFTPPQQALPRQ